MSKWSLAYNTNGFAHHRLEDALVLLSELGYDGVALTLDVHHLDPFAPGFPVELARTRELLQAVGLEAVIESGARFNLDFRRKHFPSLLCRNERGLRIDFLKRCVHTAAALGAPAISLWSGHNFDGLSEGDAFEMLAGGLREVLRDAEAAQVSVAFEPEPGMFVETLAGYARLRDMLGHPRFGLALDVGHLLVTGEIEIPEAILRHRDEILCVSVEDMKRGVHEHLPFGEGDVDFWAVFAALDEIDYAGQVAVELSRQSSMAPVMAARAFEFLDQFRSP